MISSQARKLLPIIEAFAKGIKIQCRPLRFTDEKWHDTDDASFDLELCEYRVKPSEKLRPYKFEEVPVGEVIRSKKSDGHRGLITGVKCNPYVGPYNHRELILSIGANKQIDENELLKYWVKADGSPLGVLE